MLAVLFVVSFGVLICYCRCGCIAGIILERPGGGWSVCCVASCWPVAVFVFVVDVSVFSVCGIDCCC